jgi:hypothetical protein
MREEYQPKALGGSAGKHWLPVGTMTLEDFKHTDCLFFFGQNVGSNAPRMLHQLQGMRKYNVQIIYLQPLARTGAGAFRQSVITEIPIFMKDKALKAFDDIHAQVKEALLEVPDLPAEALT